MSDPSEIVKSVLSVLHVSQYKLKVDVFLVLDKMLLYNSWKHVQSQKHKQPKALECKLVYNGPMA